MTKAEEKRGRERELRTPRALSSPPITPLLHFLRILSCEKVVTTFFFGPSRVVSACACRSNLSPRKERQATKHVSRREGEYRLCVTWCADGSGAHLSSEPPAPALRSFLTCCNRHVAAPLFWCLQVCTMGAASKVGLKKKKKKIRCFCDSSATTTTTRGRAAHVDNGVCERLEGLPHAKAEHVRVPPRGREPSNNSALRVYEEKKVPVVCFFV